MQQEDLVGSTLGQYQILDELGRGGMAVVYKAWQPSLRRYVALKVLLPYLGGDPEFIQRFQQEAIVAANLNHPHIVTIYEVGQQDGRIFIAMEYVEGTSLEQLVLDQGALPLERTIRILRQVAEALDYAHKRRFLHRDIKPANILLAEDDRVVITDFGIAKALEGSGATARLTSTGTVLGTPAYMSPEQIQGLAVDHRSDLYAFGIVAYEMLSGQVPFDGTTTALLYAQVNNPPPAITRFAPGLPPHVEWTVARMLAKQPDERFMTAGEFVEALASDRSGAVTLGYGAAAVPRVPTPPPHSGTAVMPSGTQLPQGPPPQPYGTPPAGLPASGQASYGYSATQAAPGLPGAPQQPYGTPGIPPAAGYGYPQPGYAPPVSGWVEPAPVKKKRKVWPWLLGGLVGLTIVVAVAVLGYLFLTRETPAKLLEQGNAALTAKDFAAAQTAFEAVLEKDAENAAAYRGLGWVHYEAGRYEESAAQFSKAVALDSTNAEGHKGQSLAFYALQKHEETVAASQRWLEITPGDAEGHLLLCQALYQLDRYKEASQSCTESVTLQQSAAAYRYLGDSLYALNDYPQALEAYEKWTSLQPDSAAAFASLGQAQYQLQRNQEAVQSFSKSLELEKTDDGYLGLYEAYSRAGDQNGIVRLTQQWLTFNPRSATVHAYRGWALYQLKNYSEAVAAFSSSLEIEETADAFRGLGDTFFAQQDYASALEAYSRWLALEPENALAHTSVGWVYYRNQNYAEAIRSFSKALEFERIASAYRGLGTVYYVQGEYTLALENQQQWIELEPTSAAAHGSSGWTLQKLQRYDEAAKAFQRAVELFATADYYSGLWSSYRTMAAYQQALSAAEQWVEFDPKNARAFAALGWSYVDLNNCADARSNFQKALEIDPQLESAKSGLDRCP